MIELIGQILFALLLGAIVGLTTRFLEYLIGNPWRDEVYKGSILSFFGVWIRKNYDRVEQSIEVDNVKGYSRLNMWKALWVCPFCLNVYVGLVYVGLSVVYTDFWWWLALAVLSVSHYVLGWILDNEGA